MEMSAVDSSREVVTADLEKYSGGPGCGNIECGQLRAKTS
jgi:hypothetical protein